MFNIVIFFVQSACMLFSGISRKPNRQMRIVLNTKFSILLNEYQFILQRYILTLLPSMSMTLCFLAIATQYIIYFLVHTTVGQVFKLPNSAGLANKSQTRLIPVGLLVFIMQTEDNLQSVAFDLIILKVQTL